MYRDDLAAAHARLEQLQRDLAEASSQTTRDQQRIAQLTAQLAAARDALVRIGQVQAQGQGMPAYVPPQYVYASRATTVLVLGILSLMLCCVMGPIAWSMGNEELRRIDVGQAPDLSRGSVVAGRICGIIGTAVLILGGFGMLMGIALGAR
jgi:hypothetical protein